MRWVESLREVTSRPEDLEVVLYNTGANRRSELLRIGENLSMWQDVVRKEKLIYETLNLLNRAILHAKNGGSRGVGRDC